MAYKQVDLAKELPKMADKIPQRKFVSVYPTKPLPPVELADDIWSFSPIRVARSSSPDLERQPSLYHIRQSSLYNYSHHDMPDNENIPPPSTQPRRHLDTSAWSNAAAPGDGEIQLTALTQRSNKVGSYFFNNTHHSYSNSSASSLNPLLITIVRVNE